MMRKVLKFLVLPAALAMVAAAGMATAAKADFGIHLNLGGPLFYTPPPAYYYAPPAYYYAPNCYWDAYYGRVCY
jgi:hypothetical protein